MLKTAGKAPAVETLKNNPYYNMGLFLSVSTPALALFLSRFSLDRNYRSHANGKPAWQNL
jgi:hypothetical protein